MFLFTLYMLYSVCTCSYNNCVCVYMYIYSKHCGLTNEIVSMGRDVCCRVVITKIVW